MIAIGTFSIRNCAFQIAELYSSLQNTEYAQKRITDSLDWVESQQSALSTHLDSYEKEIANSRGPGDSLNNRMGPDAEREKSYAFPPEISISF